MPDHGEDLSLLRERGVSSPGMLVDPDDDLDAVIGAIAKWDRTPDAGSALLVHMIQKGDGAGWKPTHKRTSVDAAPVPSDRRSAEDWFRIYRHVLYDVGAHPGGAG